MNYPAVLATPEESLTNISETGASENSSQDVFSAYDGSNVLFRLLRLTTWGPGLMNLGYFRFRGPLAAINLFVDLEYTQKRLVQKTLELSGMQNGHHLLDVACGRGKSSFISHCLFPASRVHGVDLLPENVATANLLFGQTSHLKYQQGNAMQLDFKDNSFDRVHCLEAAFHFPDRAQFLREAYRVLKPGGRLVVVDFAWNSPAERAILNHPETRLVREIWQYEDMYDLEQYPREAHAAGFKTVKSVDWSSRVTKPFQQTFESLLAMRKRSWLRKRMDIVNPLLGSLSDDDWEELATIARAHEFVRQRSKYMGFVWAKP